ncbi:MAG: hypothetical protein Q9210_005660 [Variospora velana]
MHTRIGQPVVSYLQTRSTQIPNCQARGKRASHHGKAVIVSCLHQVIQEILVTRSSNINQVVGKQWFKGTETFLVDYESQSDDCKILDSTPAIIQTELPTPQEQHVRSQIPPQKVQRSLSQYLNIGFDADGYTIDVKPIPIASKSTTETKVSQFPSPQDKNRPSNLNREHHENTARHLSKRKEAPTEDLHHSAIFESPAELPPEYLEWRKKLPSLRPINFAIMTDLQ